MILAIILSIITAIIAGLIIAATAPDLLGVEKRTPRHRAEPRKANQ